MGDQVADSCAPLRGKMKFDVRVLVALETLKNVFLGSAQDVMDFVHLIELVFSWEKGEEGQDLEKDAADAPDIHFVVIIPLRQQTLWRSVPPR